MNYVFYPIFMYFTISHPLCENKISTITRRTIWTTITKALKSFSPSGGGCSVTRINSGRAITYMGNIYKFQKGGIMFSIVLTRNKDGLTDPLTHSLTNIYRVLALLYAGNSEFTVPLLCLFVM